MNPLQHLHPAIVHFPITLLLVASITGLLYLFWKPAAELLLVTWWAMLLGWLATLAAVLSGLVSQSSLPPRPPYALVLNLHIGGGVGILLVYGFLLYRAWIFRQRARRPLRKQGRNPAHEATYADSLDQPHLRWLHAALLVIGAGLVFWTGLNGGELVYVWGVNVAR